MNIASVSGLVAVLFSVTFTVSAQVLDPANGHYYEVVTSDSLSWDDSRVAAAGRSYLGLRGHLATITSAAENAFLVSTFGGSSLSGKDLGGYQAVGASEPAGGWSWITGEPFTYLNWASGEPNDGAGGPAENALQFIWNASDGTWNDIDQTAVGGSFGGVPFFTGYVVEYEAIPEPAVGPMLVCGAIFLLGRGLRGRRASIIANPGGMARN